MVARLAAVVAALSLVFTVAMSKRGLFRCASDGTWHVIACCATPPLEADVTADEPACCAHVDVATPDLRDEGGVLAPSLPPLTIASTLFADVRWGTIDAPLGQPLGPPRGAPPRDRRERLASMSTLLT